MCKLSLALSISLRVCFSSDVLFELTLNVSAAHLKLKLQRDKFSVYEGVTSLLEVRENSRGKMLVTCWCPAITSLIINCF